MKARIMVEVSGDTERGNAVALRLIRELFEDRGHEVISGKQGSIIIEHSERLEGQTYA